MRIGIFTDSYPPDINGVSTSILMLQRALEKKGHQVFVVTVNPENLTYKYENEDKIIRIPGIPIGIYDYRLTGVYPLRAIKKVSAWNLDVIHSHTEFGVGTFARLIASEFNIPLVHTYHTMYEDYIETITKGYFDKSSKKLVEYITKFYCDKTCSELIVPTKKTYDLFKQKYKYDRNIYIVPTGIEVERFYHEKFKPEALNRIREKLGLKKTDFVLLYVGRLGKEKNIEFIIEVQKMLAKDQKNVKLVLVGDGPDAKDIENLVHRYNLDDSVIFAGKVAYEETPKYYNMANAFITASHFETQGLTVIEAMAASLPAICIEDESFTSTVINDFNGYIFKTKEECKNQIQKLSESKTLQRQLARGARSSAEMHSSKYFAEQVLDVYKKAIESEGANFKSKFLAFIKKVQLWKK